VRLVQHRALLQTLRRASLGAIAWRYAIQREATCRVVKKQLLPAVQERFVSVYHWAGAKAILTQSKGSSHDMGIAFRADGKGVALTAEGTKGVKNQVTGKIKAIVNKTLNNSVQYRKYVHACNFQEVDEYAVWYKPEAVSAYFSTQEPIVEKNWRYSCVQYKNKFEFTKEAGTSYTKKGGVDLGVVKVNAQWGYDSKSTVLIDVQKPTKICSSEQNVGINQAKGIQPAKLG
jgi:hypothetical protein